MSRAHTTKEESGRDAVEDNRANRRVDGRDWSKYNEELVVRGMFFLPLGAFRRWDDELEGMNRGKRGRPYEFPMLLVE